MKQEKKMLVVVDDEKSILSAIKIALRKLDIEIAFFENPKDALSFIKCNKPDMIISDQRMPSMLGTEFLAKAQILYPNSINVLLSAYNDFEDVSTAFNDNVIQKYLAKPWDNKELSHLVQRTLDITGDSANTLTKSNSSFHGMISDDQSMGRTFEQIRKASTSNIPIFINGDTGTGKELAAKACHNESSRSDESFVPVNCANFSDSLMESQLFGHVKGAFTGAIGNQQGLLAEANNGTLFMDEITCLPISLQAKLLRVLQEREFTPIGSNKLQKFEAQVITASSVKLSDAVRRGEFREDLYYRLNVISINLPKLANRGSDKILLAEHFLQKYSKIIAKEIPKLTRGAKMILLDYSWPGNVRQLENFIHSLIVLNYDKEISAEMISNHLPSDFELEKVKSKPESFNLERNYGVEPLWCTEKRVIQQAIEFYDGNVPRASAALEVSPSTLYRKINAWNNQPT